MKRACIVAATCAGISILSWLSMQLIHELGHVCGALLTGGSVVRVVVHPLAISRTDVRPNPAPGLVAWTGPLAGAIFPVIVHLIFKAATRRRPDGSSLRQRVDSLLGFFAGFCLLSNGAYLLFGTSDGVGDCGDLLRTGSPPWTLYLFGLCAVATGLFWWHRQGSLRRFLLSPLRTLPETAAVLTAVLLLVSLELWWAGW